MSTSANGLLRLFYVEFSDILSVFVLGTVAELYDIKLYVFNKILSFV